MLEDGYWIAIGSLDYASHFSEEVRGFAWDSIRIENYLIKMPTLKRKIGDLGEKLAKDYLKRKGYKIIEQNYFKREGEIDLIALDKGDLVFVEVKSRTEDSYGWPEQSVNHLKKEKIIKTAERYLQDYKGKVNNYRVDVISVEINRITKKARIKQFENILY